MNMTTYIKFSLTVPAYKAQFLAECIDSILAQTYIKSYCLQRK